MPHISNSNGSNSNGIFSKGIFGVFAVALTFGAVQFASGRDLSKGLQGPLQNSLQDPSGTSQSAINRAAKADRAAGMAVSAGRTQTISIRLDGFSDTSFLVRIAKGSRNSPAAPLFTKSGDRKAVVACEPMVSVLTEVAKQLQPGRCVT